jgi:hypothetical protein
MGADSSIAIRAMPSIGSQSKLSSRSITSSVRLFGVPGARPPVFRPSAIVVYSLLR